MVVSNYYYNWICYSELVVIAAIVLNAYSLAQSCVFDGKAMKSLGVSEVVNKETLSLFRCSEGHRCG